MIGIIIDAKTNSGDLPNRIFHKVGDLSILERTMLNCLEAEQAHKVFVSMPLKDRHYVQSGSFKNPVINPKISKKSGLDRQAIFTFIGKSDQQIDRLYRTSMTYSLDVVVLVEADCPCLPTWLLNAMISCYNREIDRTHYFFNHDDTQETYDVGLAVSIIPFWMLADAYRYSEDRNGLHQYLVANFKHSVFKNQGDYKLPNSPSLKLVERSQLELFDTLLRELDLGIDLGDLLEDINEQKPDAS